MKKYILRLIAIIFIVIGLFLLTRFAFPFIKPKGEGALQVTSNVKAQVFINDKLIGTTPLCRCRQNEMLKVGEYRIKIEPEDKSLSPFVTTVDINSSVLTAVDRTFLPGALSSSYNLTLEKTKENAPPQLLVASLPEGSLVLVDSNPQGITPFLSKTIPPGEHELVVQKEGFNKKTIKIRVVNSYKLIANILLGTKQEELLSPATSPTSLTTSSPSAVIKIGSTPTGFLRVRESPSTASREITRVTPGEEFPYIDEQSGWFKIRLPDSGEGWISGRYSQLKK